MVKTQNTRKYLHQKESEYLEPSSKNPLKIKARHEIFSHLFFHFPSLLIFINPNKTLFLSKYLASPSFHLLQPLDLFFFFSSSSMESSGAASDGSCYYSRLGIRRSASSAEIRAAYRKLALVLAFSDL